jgi:hypothetical protein
MLTRERVADVLHEKREGGLGCEFKDPRACLYWQEEAERADVVLPLINEALAIREDQLRQLLSYCKAEELAGDGTGFGAACGLVGERLAAILDGES